MNDSILSQMKKLSGIESGTDLELTFNMLADQAPIIGKVITSIKIHRLSKRLKNIGSDINEISRKLEAVDDSNFVEFLKSFLFPMILQDLLGEDEDNKISCFLSGFEQTIDNEINDQSRILIFYDILRGLRYVEIEYLISLSFEFQVHEMNAGDEKQYKSVLDSGNFEDMKDAFENKLEGLGLIDTGRLIGYKDLKEQLDQDAALSYFHNMPSSAFDDITITPFGYDFLNFFYLLDRFK